MALLLSYSIFSGIILLALYITYKLLCADERQHSYNRILLLLIYAISFGVYPIYNAVTAANAGASPAQTTKITITLPDGVIDNIGDISTSPTPHIIFTVLLWIYIIGVCGALIHTTWIACKIYRTIHGGRHISHNGYIIVITDNNSLAPFSWYKYIIMNEKDYTDSGDIIISHETEHLNNRHWIDLIIAQLTIIIEWYNPAAWLMLEEMKTLHEYQADSRVLDSGINPKDYQLLLIKKAVGERFPSLTNSLNQSKLKKRITMMYNQKSSFKRRLRSLAFVPALALALGVINMPVVASTITDAAKASISSAKTPPKSDSKVNNNSATGKNSTEVNTSETVVKVGTVKKGHEKEVEDILSAQSAKPATEVIIVKGDSVIYHSKSVSNDSEVSNSKNQDDTKVVTVGTIKKGHGKQIGSVIKNSSSTANITVITNDTVIYMQRTPNGAIKLENIIEAIPGAKNINSASVFNDTIFVNVTK